MNECGPRVFYSVPHADQSPGEGYIPGIYIHSVYMYTPIYIELYISLHRELIIMLYVWHVVRCDVIVHGI